MLYMTTLPLTEARARLPELVANAQVAHKRYEITRNGHPVAVLVGFDDYEALTETLAVLADAELLHAVREGLAQLRMGDVLNEEELADSFRRSGRTG